MTPAIFDTLLTLGSDARGRVNSVLMKEGGSFEGRADGDTLTFTWIQEGNKTTAVSGAEGSGYFVLSPDGKRLEGEWGYGDLLTGGGSWTAERIQKDRGEAFDPDAPIFNN